MSASTVPPLQWLASGREIFPELLAAIRATRTSIRLETYIYADGELGRAFLTELVAAAQRGVRVRLLVDAFGSWMLSGAFFAPLVAAGGTVHFFNPLRLWRYGVRDHRKLFIGDDSVVFLGGFNIADEYQGDGVTQGWYDLGIRFEDSTLAAGLAASFEEMFELADFHRRPLLRLRAYKRRRKSRPQPGGELLFTQPGRGASPFQIMLHRDLKHPPDICIISAYFLPTRRIRRLLMHAARKGLRVQLILAGKSDVLVSQWAARSLYRRLLKAGIEIYEYQPQILHAKLMVIGNVTYVGSSNLDIRSLNLNYEIMVRFEDKTIADGARDIFENTLKHCRQIELRAWRKSQTWWQRWQYRWARVMVAQIDPLIALRQFRALKK